MPKSPNSTLLTRLRAMGVKPGVNHIQSPQIPLNQNIAIHTIVEGDFHSTRQGEVFASSQVFPGGYRHGNTHLSPVTRLIVVSQWMGDTRVEHMSGQEMAFLDTETSGLAGGTGTYAFMIGIGRFINGEFQLRQYFMRDPMEEGALLEGVIDFLAPCKALVTYNGKAFDAPLLATRYSLHRIPNPIPDLAHIDLLPLARRLWRDRLPSRTLKYIEEHVLEAPRTVEEVPGYEIPHIYFDYLRTRDATPLKGVFYHNAMDIVALAALMSHMTDLIESPEKKQDVDHRDTLAIARLYEELGRTAEATEMYEQVLDHLDLSEGNVEAEQRVARLYRRRGDYLKSIVLLQKAAAIGHIFAHVELAKHYEHYEKDIQTALNWTLAAEHIHHSSEKGFPGDSETGSALEHRRKRLETKLLKSLKRKNGCDG